MLLSTIEIGKQELHHWPCSREEIRLLILQVLKLPMSSAMLNKTITATSNENISPAIMAELISKNQSLEGSILKIANSTDFGLSQHVATVSRAISVLGFDAIRSIALGTSVLEELRGNGSHEHLDRNRFWTHSLACAYLSRRIAGMTHRVELEAAFVSGLLHDIGKIVMDFYFPDSYRRVLARLAAGMVTWVEAEDEILGFTHTEVGTWLAQQWRFSKAIVFAIANHHGMIANDARYKSLTAAIRLANYLCSREGICLADRVVVKPLEGSVIRDLNLGQDDLKELQRILAARKEAFASFFSG